MREGNILRIGALVVLFLMAVFGNCICGKKITPPVDDNPYDPDSPDYVPPVYVPPSITISSGPPNGSTLTTDEVTFTFSGNDSVVGYRFQLVGRDTAWSAWDVVTTVTYRYLDEGDYIFYLSGRSAQQDEARDTVRFSVDAVTGPALMFKPKFQEVKLLQNFELAVMAEEVTDLMLAELFIAFDQTYFEVVSVDTGSFLATGGASVVLMDTAYDSSATINVGRALGTPKGVDGSGVIARITFKALGQADSLEITFSDTDTSHLFSSRWENDANRNIIPLNEITRCKVNIK